MRKVEKINLYTTRFYILLFFLMLAVLAITWRMVDLTVIHRDFLLRQGNARTLRIIETPAYRGMITDRNGEALAISTPVVSVWVNPQDFVADRKILREFSDILQLPAKVISQRITQAQTREFIYLKRGLPPEISEKIRALNIPGVYLQREFHRFYPEGEVTGHLVGFTNIDDQGQEGMELAYNHWLQGQVGKKRVVKDRLGHIVADVESIQEPRPGHNLVLSIDRRIQYLAHVAIKAAFEKYQPASASAIVLDIKTGEVLAMVNQPSFNPNSRNKSQLGGYRNRAATDTFEPGSVIKAFTITAALASGQYKPETPINTLPIMVHGKLLKDEHPHGGMTVSKVLEYSSNAGVTRIILSLPQEDLWDLLNQSGFGSTTMSGFPGESPGVLVNQGKNWRPLSLANLAFGYGLSVTTLQLVHAYSLYGNEGKLIPLSLLKTDTPGSAKQVVDPEIVHLMMDMLTDTVEHGTGSLAKVKGYRVAGKTGTARMAGVNGYQTDHHIATFVGLAPVSNPRLVVIAVIKDPSKVSYWGGVIAAPVFSEIMGGALRILNVPPDNIG